MLRNLPKVTQQVKGKSIKYFALIRSFPKLLTRGLLEMKASNTGA